MQAAEYARRLSDLNGEYQRDQKRQQAYVTTDKWEATNEAERTARETALLRIDEKFEDYFERAEARRKEIDELLAVQKGATEEAARAAKNQARKTNRNISIVGVALGIIVFLVNVVPSLIR